MSNNDEYGPDVDEGLGRCQLIREWCTGKCNGYRPDLDPSCLAEHAEWGAWAASEAATQDSAPTPDPAAPARPLETWMERAVIELRRIADTMERATRRPAEWPDSYRKEANE